MPPHRICCGAAGGRSGAWSGRHFQLLLRAVASHQRAFSGRARGRGHAGRLRGRDGVGHGGAAVAQGGTPFAVAGMLVRLRARRNEKKRSNKNKITPASPVAYREVRLVVLGRRREGNATLPAPTVHLKVSRLMLIES
jgi:hypothetical protein